jgi:hypothetical protein
MGFSAGILMATISIDDSGLDILPQVSEEIRFWRNAAIGGLVITGAIMMKGGK